MPYFTCRGRRLYFREHGEGALLLILPGDTSASAHHTSELTYYGQSYRAVCLDFFGTGRSERADSWPADWWEQSVEDTAELIRHLGGGPAIVVGQSGGGAIALLLAIEHPELVRAVVSDSQVERLPAAWLRQIVSQRSSTSPSTVLFWRTAHGSDWRQVVEADNRAILARAEAGCIDWFRGRLSEIACPVLLAGSLSDRIMPDLPAQIISMARQISECHVYFCAQGDHPLMWTRPREFRQAVDCFLAALEPSR